MAKDFMDREIQVSVKDGTLIISGPDGVLRLYAEGWIALQNSVAPLTSTIRFKKPPVLSDEKQG